MVDWRRMANAIIVFGEILRRKKVHYTQPMDGIKRSGTKIE